MAVVQVTGTLLAPVVLPAIGFMPGDALLHTAVVRRRYPDTWATRAPDVWKEIPLPVAYRDGVPLVSCITLPGAVRGTATRSKLTDQIVLAGHKAKVPDDLAYMYKGAITRVHTWHASDFHFWCEVPPNLEDDFCDLLEGLDLLSLGAWRHAGFGRIGNIRDPDVVDRPSALFDPEGCLLRPVPTEWHPTPPLAAHRRAVRLAPPYWTGPVHAAYCPVPTTLYGGAAHGGFVEG